LCVGEFDEPGVIPYSPGSFDHRGNGEQKWAAPGPGARSAAFFFSVERCGFPNVLTTFVTVPQANYGQHKHKDVGHLFAFIVRTTTVLKKERGVAVVACGDPAGVRAESPQH
jgi:hypothetical protein